MPQPETEHLRGQVSPKGESPVPCWMWASNGGAEMEVDSSEGTLPSLCRRVRVRRGAGEPEHQSEETLKVSRLVSAGFTGVPEPEEPSDAHGF